VYDRSCATRPNRIMSRKERRGVGHHLLSQSVLSLKSIQRYVIEWPFFSDVRLDASGCAGMVTEKFVLGIRISGLYTAVRGPCTSDRVSGGVDGGPELYGRMYPASGLDSSGTAELVGR